MHMRFPAAFALALVTATMHMAVAQEQSAPTPLATDAPTVHGLLQCASGCKKTFYFSAESDPAFAQLRDACITGCGSVPDAFHASYRRCYDGCRDLFPFRHSEAPELAGFQRSCIAACSKAR